MKCRLAAMLSAVLIFLGIFNHAGADRRDQCFGQVAAQAKKRAYADDAKSGPRGLRTITTTKPEPGKTYKRDGTKILPYGTVDPTEGVICSVFDPADPSVLYYGKPTVSGTSWSADFDEGQGGVPAGGIPDKNGWVFRLESPTGGGLATGMDTVDVPFNLDQNASEVLKQTKLIVTPTAKKARVTTEIKKHLLDIVWPKLTGSEVPKYSISKDREIIAKGVALKSRIALYGAIVTDPLSPQVPLAPSYFQPGCDWIMQFKLPSDLPPGNYRLIVRNLDTTFALYDSVPLKIVP